MEMDDQTLADVLAAMNQMYYQEEEDYDRPRTD
jgi:hypothetical protein